MDSLEGKILSAEAAPELGLVDAALLERGFMAASLGFAARVLATRSRRKNESQY
ncbi:hypothetical protein [Arthrobacter sp. 2MCAF14]|uniref:hypothetical protein n=1 Tax=Arthrobacter sp. 2MCAF14 TaxID=3232982 RepID=UPI003F8F6E0F